MSYGADVKGSADHPLLTRFTGAEIAGYHSTNYDEVELPAGKVKGLSFEQTHQAKGKVTQVAYAIPAGKTATEVMANYADAMAKAGFKPFFSCKPGNASSDCGGMSFAQVYADPLLAADPTHRNRMINLFYAANSNIRYLGATLQHGDATVDVGVMVSGPEDSQAGVLLVIVEHGVMGANEVTVDADAMSKGLASEGKIALYGLTFDTDSAKLTAASDPTLKQMSDLLHKQPNPQGVHRRPHRRHRRTGAQPDPQPAARRVRRQGTGNHLRHRREPPVGQGPGIVRTGGEQSLRRRKGEEPARGVGGAVSVRTPACDIAGRVLRGER